MKIITNKTLYQCEHCGKKYQHKGHALKHEGYCSKNPYNNHKCFNGCMHLQKQHYGNGSNYDFFCNVHKEKMFSFVAERKNFMERNWWDDNTVRMPLSCEDFQPTFIPSDNLDIWL